VATIDRRERDMTKNAKIFFTIFAAMIVAVLVAGLAQRQHVQDVVSAPLIAPTSQPSLLDDPVALATSVQESIGANIADPSKAGYQPGVTVDSADCIKETGRQFSCLLKLSDGNSLSPVVIVSEDGTDWISHAR
jgi:hypothetical protein